MHTRNSFPPHTRTHTPRHCKSAGSIWFPPWYCTYTGRQTWMFWQLECNFDGTSALFSIRVSFFSLLLVLISLSLSLSLSLLCSHVRAISRCLSLKADIWQWFLEAGSLVFVCCAYVVWEAKQRDVMSVNMCLHLRAWVTVCVYVCIWVWYEWQCVCMCIWQWPYAYAQVCARVCKCVDGSALYIYIYIYIYT